MSRAPSAMTKKQIASILVSLATDQDIRGKLTQQGAVKIALKISGKDVY